MNIMSNSRIETAVILFPPKAKKTSLFRSRPSMEKYSLAEVRIDYGQKWLNNHWRTIRSAYGKAPFFEHYCEDLEKVLVQEGNLSLRSKL